MSTKYNAGKTSKSNEKGFMNKKIGGMSGIGMTGAGVGNQTRYKMGYMDTPQSRGQMDSELKVREGMGTRTNREYI